jgi:hypothetical protein
MGTRSLTFVYDGGKNSEPILNMYRQFDGYISRHGTELAELLISGEMVNGIPVGEDQLFFNGMGDLAAQIVANFKKGSGGIYIYPISCVDCGQEYEYHVYEDFIVVKNPNKVIFDGSWDEFHSFCYDEVTQ